ncbi:MAG TPA: hypothetical protein VMV23_06685 [Candidatus Nanopelagicaceae bacterium]|nr:hypothetical protein [Candidatus Nanopelagicaceae bacterium]
MTASREHGVWITRGSWSHGLVNAGSVERALAGEEADGWQPVTSVPVTQLGFASAVWLLFKRPWEN